MKKIFDTNPKFLEVKNKNRTFISMIFFMPFNKKDSLNRTLINRMLLNYNNNIHNFNEFKRIKENLYIMEYSINTIKFSKSIGIEFKFCIPKIGIIDEFDIDSAFKFIHDSMFNPFVNNNQFDEKTFEDEKNFLLQREKDYPNSIHEYASNEFLDFYDEDMLKLHYSEYIKLLHDVNPVYSYEFYKKNIKDNNYITYIYGNLDYKDKILDAYNKYFKQEYKVLEYDIEPFNYAPLKEYKEKEVTTKYNQSVLKLLYQIKDVKEEDYFLELMLYFFLNSRENDLIFKNLRNNNNLIYSCNVMPDDEFATCIITVFYNKGDEDKILNIINDVFESIKVKENFINYKSRLVRALEYDIYSSLDNEFNEVGNKITKEVSYYYSLEEKLENIKNISYEKMLEFLNRVILTRKMKLIAGEEDE